MINKQSLWFLTLFSLILVLSVYYITMPTELFLNNQTETEAVAKTEIEESSILTAMRVEKEEERQKLVTTFEETLNNSESSSADKDKAYEQIRFITELKGIETNIEKSIKENFKLDSFVKIDDNQVTVVAIKEKHDVSLANNIMRTVQKEFEDKMYISVKFEK